MGERERLSLGGGNVSSAACKGHLEVLKWAREHGCPWEQKTCSYAASSGHLEVLKWARENGCTWDCDTCSVAARGGHLEVLKWAREHGCPWARSPVLRRQAEVILRC